MIEQKRAKRCLCIFALVVALIFSNCAIINANEAANLQKDAEKLSVEVNKLEKANTDMKSQLGQLGEQKTQLEDEVEEAKKQITTQQNTIKELEKKVKPVTLSNQAATNNKNTIVANSETAPSGGYSIPNINTQFKSYMSYRAITNRSSAQYKLQQNAYSDENGLRKVGDDYCVAMGTYYSSTVGDRFKVTMSTGNTFTIIISDIKANAHTDSTHRYTLHNNCMMEFLVDMTTLNNSVRVRGNVGVLPLFSGTFAKIEKIS